MRRSVLLTLTCLGAACGGHMRVGASPAATAEPAGAPVPPEQTVLDAPKPRPDSQRDVRADTVRRLAMNIVHDSAADAAALDSLARARPSDALPDLVLDATPTHGLNIASFADQPRVQYYLDYFSGKAHDRFQVWLARMPRFEPYARARLADRGLPGDLVYLALIESGFAPEAVSKARAVGMWQFMSGTGKLYGLRIDNWVDERRDPIKATDAAAHHLADLTERFGSYYLAAAAYNAGAGRVERGLGQIGAAGRADDSLELGGDGSFFSLADTRLIRDETKNYVPQLIAAAVIAKAPGKYGFEQVDGIAPFPLDSVIVDGGTGLDLIARLADTSLDALRELNPHLIRGVTPPGDSYAVRVPPGTAERIAAAYADTPAQLRDEIIVHTVKIGETVMTLAKSYRTSADLIRSANRSARGAHLKVGASLYIPVETTLSAALLREPDPVPAPRVVTRTYVVKAGETVAGIAKRYGVSIASLRTSNHLTADASLKVGEKLTIRGGSAPVTAHTTAAPKAGAVVPHAAAATLAAKPPAAVNATAGGAMRTHVVAPGETVSAIAAKFGVTQATLIAVNGLGKSAKIHVGQTLRIPRG